MCQRSIEVPPAASGEEPLHEIGAPVALRAYPERKSRFGESGLTCKRLPRFYRSVEIAQIPAAL